MAQWSERSPFTSEVAGSILSGNFLNVTRTQYSTHVRRVKPVWFSTRRFFSREQARKRMCLAGDVVSVCRQPIKLLFSLFARTNSLS